MATYKYSVDCIYETDKGQGKEYTPFNCEIELSRFYPEGAGSHILRRFLPMLIRKQKSKPLYSGMKHWLITDIKKVNDDFELVGQDIREMNEEQLQKLACMYDLFEIPLPQTKSIIEARNIACLSYLENVVKVPLKTTEEQEKSGLFKKQLDGSFKLDFGDQKVIVEIFQKASKKKEVKTKTVAEMLEEAKKRENAVLENKAESNIKITDDSVKHTDNDSDDGFPSLNDLTNN